MLTKRAHIVLPEKLVKEIDKFVGARRRSAFIAEVAERELKRLRLLEILKADEPIWKSEDHPELKHGAAKWVKNMRAESEARFKNVQRTRS
jgi:hypothetical protein